MSLTITVPAITVSDLLAWRDWYCDCRDGLCEALRGAALPYEGRPIIPVPNIRPFPKSHCRCGKRPRGSKSKT